jgi:uncharacterized OsmC-like protein
MGQSYFRVSNHWEEGGLNHVNIKGFYAAGKEQQHLSSLKFDADEPVALLGKDGGANPVEYLLTALSSCMTTSIVYHAAANGYEIEALDSEFEGDLDLRGFLSVSKDVPIGFKKIRALFKLKTDAPEEKIAAFYKFSPVYSMVSAAVPIEVQILKEV